MVDAHLLAAAHSYYHVGRNRSLHRGEPYVHDADFGHGGAVGRDHCWGEADSLLQDVIAALANGDCFQLFGCWPYNYAKAGE